MKKALVFGIMLLFAFSVAKAEFTLDEVQQAGALGGAQLDLNRIFAQLLNGEIPAALETAPESILAALKSEVCKTAEILGETIAYVLAGAALKALVPGGRKEGASRVIHLVTLISLLKVYASALAETEKAMLAIGNMSDALAPCLASLLTVAGGVKTAALITPMGAFSSGVIAGALSRGGRTLAGLSAAMTAGAALGAVRLTKLHELVRSMARWLIGACLGGFLVLMNTGGLIAGAHDGTFFKGAKYLAGSLIPIVGSEIAGKMESLASSAALVMNAAGVTGLAAVLSITVRPVLRLAVYGWGLRMISAACETIGDEAASSMLDGFSKVMLLLCALVSAASCMLLILLGAAIAMGGRIGI